MFEDARRARMNLRRQFACQGQIDRRTMLAGLLGAAATAATVSYAKGPARAADLPAVTLEGAEVVLSDAKVSRLARRLKGSIIRPGDAEYEGARKVWNAMFDRRPALIVRCASVQDVQTAVKFAREHQLLTAVRCGGHSASGQSSVDRGLVIDLSPMRRVDVDPKARTVRADGGCLLGDLDAAAQALGLATTFGVVSHTGVGGLTLGGGMGRLQRQHGLTIDNLREVKLVTAEGKLLTANATENPDLFWALRGGGGNFGIGVSFEFGLHPFEFPVTTNAIAFGADQIRPVLDRYFDYAPTAPEPLFLAAVLVRNAQGAPLLSLSANWMGDPAQAEATFRTLASFGKPLGAPRGGSIKYLDIQKQSDAGGNAHGNFHYQKAGMLGAFEDRTQRGQFFDNLLGYFTENPLPGGRGLMLLMGGAVNRVPADGTAYPHRAAIHNIEVGGDSGTREGAEKYLQWGRGYWKGIDPFTGGGFYINAASADDDAKRIAGNYGPNHERLVAAKTKYDPTNQFRMNANIRPKSRA
ncbi:MAG: FAD-binding protein [Burkholderiales bacterium]|nr:FAD-binding protein [Burkholderiales bacterium]